MYDFNGLYNSEFNSEFNDKLYNFLYGFAKIPLETTNQYSPTFTYFNVLGGHNE